MNLHEFMINLRDDYEMDLLVNEEIRKLLMGFSYTPSPEWEAFQKEKEEHNKRQS